ncbi:MAG: phosphotransferase [Akkermansiaceae bacterium]|nr:phosphotransferase [Akkermansiaceae bacterium]
MCYCVQVLAHVAMRLKDLHASGYVHRDIKPGNIMLLHRKNRWTLIDFGCVAPIGQLAGLSFTLHYAAPEAVEAWHQGGFLCSCCCDRNEVSTRSITSVCCEVAALWIPVGHTVRCA